MKLVVAEKPSVARDIAAVIGADEHFGGVMRGNGYIVTSACGHLLRMKKPQEYDEKYGKWGIDDLPLIPDFEFVPPDDEKAEALIQLAKLMNSAEVDEIICATDAGREGECIFRYIYDYVGCTKPVERLWISSMTEQAIRDGFADLRPSSEYDKLFTAGYTRSKIDWLWGMNLSRLYSFYFDIKCSIGRVQTATINMIVQRDNEIDHFTKKPYYKLRLPNGAEWYDDEGDCFTTYTEAENVKAKCEKSVCKVISVDTKLKKENRPLLFSLTSLQIEANEKLGFSAATTLVVMQSLYEKKLLTYPRTDSNYLTDDMAAILPERVNMLIPFNEGAEDLLATGLTIDSRIINNGKVSDHHAIIPTEYISNAHNMELSENEKAILEMVITRFLAALSPQYEYTETEYIFDVGGEKFHCKTKATTILGWKKYYSNAEVTAPLSYSEGDEFPVGSIEVAECETAPPKRFTESTLLKAMENIDRRIEDKELAEYVSERGLGTPATRAVTIENMIERGFVERENKALISTEKGRKLIENLPDEVKSVEMTAAMELQLAAIENGTATADEVLAGIVSKINAIYDFEGKREHISFAPPRESLGKCPKCGGNVYKYVKDGKAVYYCENSPKTCFFRIYEDTKFFSMKGKKVTDSVMKSLLTTGKVKMTGLYSEKTGKTYDATIVFGMDWTDPKSGKTYVGFGLEFDNSKKKGAR